MHGVYISWPRGGKRTPLHNIFSKEPLKELILDSRLAVDMEIERETLGNERDKKLEGSDNPIKVTCLSAPMYHFNFEF